MTSLSPIAAKKSRHSKFLLIAGAGWLLAGCSATTLGNFPDTTDVVERADYIDRKPVPDLSDYQEAAQARIKELLARPLTVGSAVEIAMLNSPGLQEVYQKYQIWDEDLVAEMAEAAKKEADPNHTNMDWVAARLALMKSVNTVYRYDFPDEYFAVAEDFIETGEEVRKAYFEAVAAAQLQDMLEHAATATQAAAELANAQYEAGTANRRSQALQHMTHAEIVKALAEARLEAVVAREALNRLLVLWGDDVNWSAPETLPELPEARPAYEGLEEYALKRRLDVLSERKSWALWHTAVDVRSEVRENHAALLTRYDIAKYQRDTVLPLSAVVLEETQLEYNGMLMGIYDLIDDTRGQIEAGREYVEALRDFWIAEAELSQAVGGTLPN
ncbi:MAG: TolC family protein [Rhodospirillaceae bacterium]|nr:TolC family protein [Rhodospirillaceae bacterium]